MAKRQIDLPEHTRLNLGTERVITYQSPEIMYKPEPVCGCGCKDTPNAYNYDGEMFASKDCVIKMMISEGWLKEVS